MVMGRVQACCAQPRRGLLISAQQRTVVTNPALTSLVARYTSEYLCTCIFERHAGRIRVKKPHVAVANLVRIVEAFLKLSVRKGFHATSMRDLAEASGLSMGGLYSYFDSKETLLVMVLEEVENAVTELLADPPTEVSADPERHLAWAIEAHIHLTEAMQPWFVFAYMEAKSFPPSARKAAIDSEAATERVFAEALTAGMKREVFSDIDPDFTAALIKPLLQDWYVKRSKWRKRGITAPAYAQKVIWLVLNGIERR